MKATGMVRRIDELGRIVIPKEIRRSLRIRAGDPMEIYTDANGEVIFKKHSPLATLEEIATGYAKVLSVTGGYPVLVCDRDNVVAVGGVSSKELLGQAVSPSLEELVKTRMVIKPGAAGKSLVQPVSGSGYFILAGEPIISNGDVQGYIMFVSKRYDGAPMEEESRLLITAALFLGKQLEE